MCGCQPVENTDIAGKWSVDNVSLNDVTLDDLMAQNLKDELESMVFYFKEDGLLLYSNFYRTGAHGKWTLNQENQSLECNYQFERATYTDTYSLHKTSATALILESIEFEGVTSAQIFLVRMGK